MNLSDIFAGRVGYSKEKSRKEGREGGRKVLAEHCV